MNISIAIVGLPNAGKSTLFNALLARQIANVAPYPFCTIEPNQGIVEVPDIRLVQLARLVQLTEKMDHFPPMVSAVVEFVDIAGLVAGASKGEGLGNKFLAHIRECAAIVHVLRGFSDETVVREAKIDPQSDFDIIKTELCLADLQTLEKWTPVNPVVATKEDKVREDVVSRARKGLEDGIEVRNLGFDSSELELIKGLFLLTAKPALFVLNVDEALVGLGNKALGEKFGLVRDEGMIPICAKTEMELVDLEMEERKSYLAELGMASSGLERLIKQGFEVLRLQTFLTAGEKEVRAWTIRRGQSAVLASGVIHTDFMAKFIKAKVVSYQDFVEFGGWKNCAEKGKVRVEGKEYVMRDGDVVEFMIGT